MAKPGRAGYQFSKLGQRQAEQSMYNNPATYGWKLTGELAQDSFILYQMGPALAYYDEYWRVKVGESNGIFPNTHIKIVSFLTKEEIEKQGELCKAK